MELNNFVSMEFLAGFAGTLVGVELIVTCTKELPIVKKLPTKMYTFILALIHLLIVKYAMGTFKFSLGGLYLLIINSFLISIILCSGYDVALGNIQIPQLNGEKKNIKIKNETSTDLKRAENTEEFTTKKSVNTTFSSVVNSSPNPSTPEEDNICLSNRGRNSNLNDKIT